MKRDLVKIDIKTLPNGYSLSVNGSDYMYFNEIDLLAGFMAHVGMQESNALERGTLLSNLFSAMMGEAYANAVSTLKQRVGLLTSKYEATLEQMDRSIAYVNQAENTITGFRNEITKLADRIKAVGSDNNDVRIAVEKVKIELDGIAKLSNKVMKQLSNSATIVEAMDSAKKTKNEAEEPSEAAQPTDDTPAPKKQRGGRKKNDEKVLAEIERQAKNNPNLK